MQIASKYVLYADGWISLILSNRERVVLQFNNGIFMNQGFVLNGQNVFGNHQIGDISYYDGVYE